MKKIFILFLAGLIIFFGFITKGTAQQQTYEEQRDRQKLEQEKLELQQEQQQLEQQRLYQQQLAQQQQINQQQLAQQQLYQQELAQQAEVVIEPDMYLFGGDYDGGRYVHNYSHRGFESRGAAHFGGERRGRR